MTCGQAGVQEWALDLNFIRTRPGAEFDVVNRLEKNFSRTNVSDYRLFTTFGHYDLIGVQIADDVNHVSPLVIDPSVEEICSYRFYPTLETGDRARLLADLQLHPFNAAVFVKIEPRLILEQGARPEWGLIEHLGRKLDAATNYLFIGLGHAEILLLHLGSAVEEVFDLTQMLGSLSTQNLREDKDSSYSHSSADDVVTMTT